MLWHIGSKLDQMELGRRIVKGFAVRRGYASLGRRLNLDSIMTFQQELYSSQIFVSFQFFSFSFEDCTSGRVFGTDLTYR